MGQWILARTPIIYKMLAGHSMIVVAGLSLKNLEPRVWDASSPYFLPQLQAVMVSYAEFHRMPARRRAAVSLGLHRFLDIPKRIKIYLDNGAFYFLGRDGEAPRHEYEEFVAAAKPDWYPIPQDFIPTPKMTLEEQRDCYRRTMAVNRAYKYDGFVPVIHVGSCLKNYTVAIAQTVSYPASQSSHLEASFQIYCALQSNAVSGYFAKRQACAREIC